MHRRTPVSLLHMLLEKASHMAKSKVKEHKSKVKGA